MITTFAGNGQRGFSGDGGPASSASLNSPFMLALDHKGNLFFTDLNNNRVRKIDPQGIITTIAGNGDGFVFCSDGGLAVNTCLNPEGLAVDSAGNLFIAETIAHRIRMVNSAGVITTVAGTIIPGSSGDGGPAINATLNQPVGLALDNAGNLFIADSASNQIRRIDPARHHHHRCGHRSSGVLWRWQCRRQCPAQLSDGCWRGPVRQSSHC